MEPRLSPPVLKAAAPARDEVAAWLAAPSDGGLRASIHLSLPWPRGFDDLKATPKRYRSLLDEVDRQAAALGASAEEARELVAALRGVDVQPESLTRHARSIAAFAEPGRARAFALQGRVKDRACAGDSFLLRPLVDDVRRNQGFRVLALSEGRVELFEGDRWELRAIEAPDVPRDLAAVVGTEIGRSSNSVQHHPSARSGDAAVFHGHGGASRGRRIDRERFHVAVARAVRKRWAARNDPLVLVADVGHQGAFQDGADLPGLLEDRVVRSPDTLDAEALLELARPVVERFEDARDRERLERLGDRLAQGRAVAEPRDALLAALQGRVDRLWLDREARWPGRADAATGAVTEGRGGADALDDLAAWVVARGGDVAVVDPGSLPGGAQAVAELRGGAAPAR